MTEQIGDPWTSEIARPVLEYLQRRWPEACDITLGALGIEDADRGPELLALVEALSDHGYLMYEALLMYEGAPCFTDALITRSGSAALDAARSA
jgi:hypothetical protein